MYITVGEQKHIVTVDIYQGKVIGSSPLQNQYHSLVPCVLPPWLGSSQIPTAEEEEEMDSVALFAQWFAAKRLRDVAKSKLSPHKRRIINETGFGDLMRISPFTVPHDLIEWIVMNTDPNTCELRRNRKKSIVFTRDM